MSSHQEAPDSRQMVIARLVLETEAQAAATAAQGLEEEMRKAVGLLSQEGKVLVTSTRGSVAICRQFTEKLRSNGVDARFVHPNQAARGHLGEYRPGDPVLILSVDGAVIDLLPLVAWLRHLRSPTIGIVSQDGPVLAGEVSVLLDASTAPASDRRTLSSGAASAVTMALCDALVVGIQQGRGPSFVVPAESAQPISTAFEPRSFVLVTT